MPRSAVTKASVNDIKGFHGETRGWRLARVWRVGGGETVTCARDGTPTQLTCITCETPICPQCLVRTDVGLRCDTCAKTASPMPAPRSGVRPAVIGAVLAVVALLATGGLILRGGGKSSESATRSAADQPQHVSRPDLGFSLDLPAAWIVDTDQTPGSIFFAHATPPRSSARIFRGQTEQPLDQNMGNVVEGLRQQGAHDFSQQPVQIGDLPGIRLDYLAADGPAGALPTHSSYRVKKGNALFSLSLATTDVDAERQVLADIASSFRLL